MTDEVYHLDMRDERYDRNNEKHSSIVPDPY